MPDLAQGYSADVVLAANESVRVSTTGQATVTSAYGAPNGTTTLNANTQTFGPYQVPAKLRITSVTGTANYAQPALVPVTANPATGEFSPPVSGDGTVTVNARDGLGRVISFTDTTGTYTVTYGSFGPATVSGNGKITTYNYSAAGVLTSVTTA